MKNSIAARGYTKVVLVLNMRLFVGQGDLDQFDRLRGSKEFVSALRTHWPKHICNAGAFELHNGNDPSNFPSRNGDDIGRISIDEVGFLMGVFRRNALDAYTTPTYRLRDKDKVIEQIPREILDNVQFKQLFLTAMQEWEINVRPTATGMLVITFKHYYSQATPLIQLATDVTKLQTAFDRPSAIQKLRSVKQDLEAAHLNTDPVKKQKSIEALLTWMDNDQATDASREYIPVHWKIASEVCRRMIQDAGMSLQLKESLLRFQPPTEAASTPFHDSYVIYHFDEIIADAHVVKGARRARRVVISDDPSTSPANGDVTSDEPKASTRVTAFPPDILSSKELQQHVIGLIEGSILRPDRYSNKNANKTKGKQGSGNRPKSHFPVHSENYIRTILECNLATWSDELCLLTPRAAVVMPSHKEAEHALLISNFTNAPNITNPSTHITYKQYWSALERMIEFVLEIRVLAQVMERASANLLQEFESEIASIRGAMSRQDIEVNYRSLAAKVDRVANISRILSIGQSLNTPTVWSRAEFVAEKARLLLNQQEIPALIQHTERNVNSLNSLMNHIDELYLADLSERNNKTASILSLLLAGISLSSTLFALASFWADIGQLQASSAPLQPEQSLILLISYLGNAAALILILVAPVIVCYSLYQLLRVPLAKSPRAARIRNKLHRNKSRPITS